MQNANQNWSEQFLDGKYLLIDLDTCKLIQHTNLCDIKFSE